MMKRCSVLVVVLIFTAIVRAALSAPREVTTAEPLSRFPRTIDGWVGEDQPLTADVLKIAGVDDYLNRSYRSEGRTLGLYVGYYRSQRQGESLHSPLHCLPGAGWQPVVSEPFDLRVGATSATSGDRRVRKLLVRRGVDQLLVLYWYQTLKRVTGSEYARKLFLMDDAFRTGRTDVALVRIIAPAAAHDHASETRAASLAQPFAERLLPEIQTRLFRN